MLHPFMPFITEELWQALAERKPGESIMYAPMPEAGAVDAEILAHMAMAQEIVNGVRGVRARKNISPKEVLPLLVLGKIDGDTALFASKLANLGEISMDAPKMPLQRRLWSARSSSTCHKLRQLMSRPKSAA